MSAVYPLSDIKSSIVIVLDTCVLVSDSLYNDQNHKTSQCLVDAVCNKKLGFATSFTIKRAKNTISRLSGDMKRFKSVMDNIHVVDSDQIPICLRSKAASAYNEIVCAVKTEMYIPMTRGYGYYRGLGRELRRFQEDEFWKSRNVANQKPFFLPLDQADIETLSCAILLKTTTPCVFIASVDKHFVSIKHHGTIYKTIPDKIYERFGIICKHPKWILEAIR